MRARIRAPHNKRRQRARIDSASARADKQTSNKRHAPPAGARRPALPFPRRLQEAGRLRRRHGARRRLARPRRRERVRGLRRPGEARDVAQGAREMHAETDGPGQEARRAHGARGVQGPRLGRALRRQGDHRHGAETRAAYDAGGADQGRGKRAAGRRARPGRRAARGAPRARRRRRRLRGRLLGRAAAPRDARARGQGRAVERAPRRRAGRRRPAELAEPEGAELRPVPGEDRLPLRRLPGGPARARGPRAQRHVRGAVLGEIFPEPLLLARQGRGRQQRDARRRRGLRRGTGARESGARRFDSEGRVARRRERLAP